MAYEYHSPYTLDELDDTLPTPSEDVAVYDEAMRQTRTILKQVFLAEHNPDGTHKWGAESLAPNSITTDKLQSDATDDSKRAVGSNHIKNLAVTSGKMATSSVTTSSIADASVTDAKLVTINGAKLQAGTVPVTAFADKAITGDKLANNPTDDALRAVDTDHIKDEALVARHFPTACVTADKISTPVDRVLVGGRNATALSAVVSGNLIMRVDETQTPPQAVFTLNIGEESILLPYALLRELAPTFPTGGGDATADTWQVRPSNIDGNSRAWSVKDKFDVLNVVEQRIVFVKPGTYLVMGWASAFKVNLHQIRLYRKTDPAGTLLVGGMVDADPSTTSQSQSVMQGFITVRESDEIELQHWTQNSFGAVMTPGFEEYHRGLGRGFTSANNKENQLFASLLFIKVG
jgi:hypothetical protein